MKPRPQLVKEIREKFGLTLKDAALFVNVYFYLKDNDKTE